MSREVLGGFEHRVLLAVMRLGEGAYTVPIVLELEKHAGRAVAHASVYVTLRRLEEKGYLSSKMVAPPAQEGGRDRRVFAVERAGLEAVRESRRVLDSLSAGLEQLGEA